MIDILNACKSLFTELLECYMIPYLKKIKGMTSPVKIWRFGEQNDDKIIYFITDISKRASGTFSLYLTLLSEISFAQTMGWIPVIDDTSMLVRKMTWKKKLMLGDYFQFRNKLSVEEVMNSKNVVFCKMTNRIYLFKICNRKQELYKIRNSTPFFKLCPNELEYWRNLAHNNLFYRADVQLLLDRAYSQVIQEKEDVLSVAVREGKMFLDSKTRKISGEYAQPSLEKLINVVRKYYLLWQCQYIYLSCEACETVELFQKVFGLDKVLLLGRYRFKIDELKKISSLKSGKKFYKKADKIHSYDIDYLKDMYILSKGDFLICPINCGTEAAFVMSDGFRDYHIIESDLK